MFARRTIENPWEGRIEPFKIIGNVYFIGTHQASSHLVDTGEGLLVIDTGYENTLYLLIDSIYKLGFRPADVKYIINTHWHWDHTEGSRALSDLSGGKNVIGKEDAENAKRYFTPDILVEEGDTLTLGNTTVRFLETPGHTKGTISLFFETKEGEKTYRVGMFGGAGANTLKQGSFDYEGCREDYRNSVNRLRQEAVDVFIGNHTWNNNTEEHAKILAETGENRFIDASLWHRFLDYCEKRLDEIIAKEV